MEKGLPTTSDAPGLHGPTGGEPYAAAATIAHVRRLIEKGEVRPGDRLAPERELARQAGVGRSGAREGLCALAALGIVRAQRGSGTFISAGPTLGSEVLGLLAALYGVTEEGLLEARRVLERGTAALAAERASGDQIAAIAHEVAGMFASLEDPQAFLQHDLRFHRAVAAGADNPILAALLEMVTSRLDFDRVVRGPTSSELRASADRHRRIYRAIRDRDITQARAETGDELDCARTVPGLSPRTPRTPRRQRCRQAAKRPAP
jgi:GntR family transcriptional regulator, transcriptional repressor for pyruvate dehydrogenase complex